MRYEMYSVASMALRVCLPLRIANWLAAEGGRESAANVISERHASRAAMAAAVRVCLWSLKFDPQLANYDHTSLTGFSHWSQKAGNLVCLAKPKQVLMLTRRDCVSLLASAARGE